MQAKPFGDQIHLRPHGDKDPMPQTTETPTEKEDLEQRFRRYLPEFKTPAVQEMLEVVARNPIRIIKAPVTGLIMVNVRDCFDTAFHLGEALVTRTEVEYRGVHGHATVMGQEPEKALLAAGVAAVLGADGAATLEELWPLVLKYGQEIDATREKQAKLAAATRVAFENMAKEG